MKDGTSEDARSIARAVLITGIAAGCGVAALLMAFRISTPEEGA